MGIIFKQIISYLKYGPTYIRFFLKGNRKCFNIFTHMTAIERLLLYKLSINLQKGATIVEIGSYLGASSSFLASAAREMSHTVYCVDTWNNDSMSEGSRDTFQEFLDNIKPYNRYIRPLRGESKQVAKECEAAIDLLFIDGDHSYDGAKRDVECWGSKVKHGGIIVLHDYGWAEGVQMIVCELIKPIALEEHAVENTYWARIR